MKIASLNLGKTEKPESERFAPFMTFLKFVIPGFKEAYDQKMALQNYDAKMKAQYRIRVPLQETPKSIFDLPYKYTTKNTKPKKQLVSKKLFGGKNEYRFRRGSLNLNNGYGVIYDLIMLTIQNGYPTYDVPPVVAGRTIYQTPKGNDTIFYRNNPDIFNHTPIGDSNQQRAKNYFYKMIRKAPSEGLEYRGTKYWNSLFQSTYNARNRALRGYQEGGPIERTDNIRVVSGRPLVILNKIPWGAGKGPAGEGPMRLFNDPYVNIGLMAMGPLAKPKVQHDVFPVKEVLKFSFLPLKEIMTRMTTKYGNYLNIKGPKGRVNAWKIERLPGVDNFTEIQNLLFK